MTPASIKQLAEEAVAVRESTDSADIIAVMRGHYDDDALDLAKAVLAILPFVAHFDTCHKGDTSETPCTCGLDSALAALDAQEAT